MLLGYCIANNISVKPCEYLSTEPLVDEKRKLLRFRSRSTTRTEDVRCPHCNGQVHICRNCAMQLRDMPSSLGTRQIVEMSCY